MMWLLGIELRTSGRALSALNLCNPLKDLFLFYVYVCVCVSVSHVTTGTLGGQKKAVDPMELKLQAAVVPEIQTNRSPFPYFWQKGHRAPLTYPWLHIKAQGGLQALGPYSQGCVI